MIQRGLDREERQVGKLEFYLSQVWYGGGGATTDGRRVTTTRDGSVSFKRGRGWGAPYPAPQSYDGRR